MKRFVFLTAAVLLLGVPGALAQNHGEFGAYADYVRLANANDQNYWGLGGRLGFNIAKHAQLEGEISYDFSQAITTGTVTNGITTVSRTDLRLLHGLFGPKIGTSGALRVFVTAKGGFLNFSATHTTVLTGFTGTFSQITAGNTNGVFYPGAGVEGFLGPIGLRLDVGDLMYISNGAHNNLRVTLGPQFRF